MSTTSIAPTDTLVYKTTTQGLQLKVDVYSPAGDANTKPTPVILWFHIGGLLFGDRRDPLFPQWLAQECYTKGWTFLSADYRLIPEASIDEVLEDVKDAWQL